MNCECKDAKMAMLILNRMHYENIAVMCLKCDMIWKIQDSARK